MREPRLEDFDTSQPRRKPDDISIGGIVPLVPKPQSVSPKTIDPVVSVTGFRENFAGKPEIRQVGNPASRQVRLPESPTAGKMASLLDRNLAECVLVALETKAAKKESFRFPDELMNVLEDLPCKRPHA